MTQITIDSGVLKNLAGFTRKVWHELDEKCKKIGPETERQIEEVGFDREEADRAIELAEQLFEDSERRKVAAQARLGELLANYGAISRSREMITRLHEACHALSQGQVVELNPDLKSSEPNKRGARSDSRTAQMSRPNTDSKSTETKQMPRPGSGSASERAPIGKQEESDKQSKGVSGSKRRPTEVFPRAGSTEQRASQRLQRMSLESDGEIPVRDDENLKRFDRIQLLHSISEHLNKRKSEGCEIGNEEIELAIRVKFRDLAYTQHDAKNLFEFMIDPKNLPYKIAVGKEFWEQILGSLAVIYNLEFPSEKEA